MSLDDPTPLPQQGLVTDRASTATPAGPGEREHHPLAALFPLLEGPAFKDLCADIAQHGLREPIVLYENQVLDGRNRQRACVATSTPPVFREWNGPDPLAYILSLNMHRRHLNESQRAMVAARVATMSRGRPAVNTATAAISQGRASELCSVSPDSIQRARKVLDSAIPELVAAVDQGEVAVSIAARIAATGPAYYQQGVLDKMHTGLSKRPHVTHNSGENEWYTPREHIALARAVLGEIDLDPASCAAANTVVSAKRYYSIEDDGLCQEWAGNLFLNPPYTANLVAQFIDKLLDSPRVAQAIVLTNNNTETDAAQALMQAASAICFPAARVRYWGPLGGGSPLQGQMFCYLGPHPEVFAEHFGRLGRVWQDRATTISMQAPGAERD